MKVPTKLLYRLPGYYKNYIKYRGEAWHLYRYYSSNSGAEKARKALVLSPFLRQARFKVFKTAKGWGIFQLPKKEFRAPVSELVRI